MRVLTVRQPWASLIAIGVKTVETRSWRATSLIGERFAIHAAANGLPTGGIAVCGWLAINTITDSEFQGPQPCNPLTGRQRRIPRRAQTPTLMWPGTGPHQRLRDDNPRFTHHEYLPLGAIVATARLTGCALMGGPTSFRTGGFNGDEGDRPGEPVLVIHEAGSSAPWSLALSTADTRTVDVTDQLPYGDFRCGRWGWLLDDVEPLEVPVPFRGGQGLSRSWEPGS